MPHAYIIDALRTPMGRRKGGLSEVHPVDLAAHTLNALVERTGIDPAGVDDVILGCVNQIGPQTACIARTSWLAAGLPSNVTGVTVDRRCGSSQQAIHFAAQAIMAGVSDLVVAGGVENMSIVPIGSPYWATNPHAEGAAFGDPYAALGWVERFGGEEISQFRGAEIMAERWAITRDEMEEMALESHLRTERAWQEGRFDAEVVPYRDVVRDEGVRPDTTLEKMASLKPVREGGTVTAATSSQISDGASALLVASEAAVERHGLEPMAKIVAMTLAGDDPIVMLSAPIPATRQALERAGLDMADIDISEVNEAFAPVVLAWEAELGVDHAKVNPNGGAIALGHPLGATGARMMTTLVHELERTGGRYGLQTMCEGGGQANATIVEMV
ncbi:MAG: acetyl-CoA C-acetyltransferase [Acidimicrobiales bacterium]